MSRSSFSKSWLFRRGLIARASSGGYESCSEEFILPLGTISDDDLCRSLNQGRSALDFRDTGLAEVCSDSEELETDEALLDAVGDRLGRELCP